MSLQVDQIVKRFGGIEAVQGLSFALECGECVALIGPNGAGKSTTFACIAGQQTLSSGALWWAGERIDHLDAAQRLARGVARTFQVAQTFEALSVLQNVQLALQAQQGLAAWDLLDNRHVTKAHELLARVGLTVLAQCDVRTLPYGAKKRLELALALAGIDAVPQARLLLLDEPAAGLAGPERAELMALVRALAHADQGGAGLAVLYTEHNMDAVFGVADRVLVLMEGKLVAQGSAQEVSTHVTVRTRYLGVPPAVPAPTAPQSSQDAAPVLALERVCAWYGAAQALFQVSLVLHAGELLVLQGLNGAGKSTLLKSIMGLTDRVTGVVRYENNSITELPVHRRARLGLGYVPEDRRLFAGLSVRENLRLAARAAVDQQEERVLALFPLLKPLLARLAAHTSGGEQQMLALARTLMTGPRLLLLDEPCEGIAPVLVHSLVQALLALRAQGMPMLVAEQNSVLARSADRVITLVAGQIRP